MCYHPYPKSPHVTGGFSFPAKELNCWKLITPGCVSSRNIGGKLRGNTVSDCKQLCRENSECKSIEYGVPHGGLRTNYKTGDCQVSLTDSTC